MFVARVNEGTLRKPVWVELTGVSRDEVVTKINRRVSRANRFSNLALVITFISGIILGMNGIALTSRPIETLLLLAAITTASFLIFDVGRNMRRSARWPGAEIREVHA